jgi:hypothetical protein
MKKMMLCMLGIMGALDFGHKKYKTQSGMGVGWGCENWKIEVCITMESRHKLII